MDSKRFCFPGLLKAGSILFITILSIQPAVADTIPSSAWIRINQLGYFPASKKVAVWCSKKDLPVSTFQLIDALNGDTVFRGSSLENMGAYGPFKTTCRLDFSAFKKPGRYFLRAGDASSPIFPISADAYKGAADFCLQYMRQQRSGFNPYLRDSCHTQDGYTMYGPMPDSTHIDVSGGWHDASDYLQYSTTSANATWHLLAAYRDFPKAFGDEKQANGLDGKNGISDVLDEASWGLRWLLKMHPVDTLMFNQLADDRDHQGMRLPKLDNFYGKGFERPVYFITGEPQGLFKYKNRTKGTSSTAAKFASAFALAQFLCDKDPVFGKQVPEKIYYDKAFSAFRYALRKPGVTQTAPGRAPYFYEEDNWVDDMELAAASIQSMLCKNKNETTRRDYRTIALDYAQQEKITPWLGADTAKHYQWYPFINAGHYELAKQLKREDGTPSLKAQILAGYYKKGIEKVWTKAKQNAFYRGIPFIWCSNNLTASFAIQCFWYKKLTGDNSFSELEQANVDWLFGCNPWGTSMVYGLPGSGDSPVDPHSSFTHIKNYPINGGLVDGPVYTSIFSNLIGIQLQEEDEYAAFQSGLAVYHDDYGDYSTNEPTMDGTASLIYLLAAKETEANLHRPQVYRGGLTRGRRDKKRLALVFTGHEFADGGNLVAAILKKHNIKASFFLTGEFYRNNNFRPLIKKLQQQDHYLGPHSDQHLLYCDWSNQDSLFVTKAQFKEDLSANLLELKKLGSASPQYFLPPYEWYNDSIAAWTKEMGMELVNYSPGTLSTADYTYPPAAYYRTSDEIFYSIMESEEDDPYGLNGFVLLMHIGTDPRRTDKFYKRLGEMISVLKRKGYAFTTLKALFDQ